MCIHNHNDKTVQVLDILYIYTQLQSHNNICDITAHWNKGDIRNCNTETVAIMTLYILSIRAYTYHFVAIYDVV